MSAIAWSPDDVSLLSSAEHEIKLWNVEVSFSCPPIVSPFDFLFQTGICMKTMSDHSHTVNGLCWMADGSGFVTGGMDRRIMEWVSGEPLILYKADPETQNTRGEMKFMWPPLDIRILELAITPDGSKLVAIGQLAHPTSSTTGEYTTNVLTHATIIQASGGAMPVPSPGSTNGNSTDMERRIVVYDLETRQELW
jgi:WD repeat-containing protein 26